MAQPSGSGSGSQKSVKVPPKETNQILLVCDGGRWVCLEGCRIWYHWRMYLGVKELKAHKREQTLMLHCLVQGANAHLLILAI